MAADAWAALIGLIVGLVGGTVLARWRYQVVKELRRIRALLERLLGGNSHDG